MALLISTNMYKAEELARVLYYLDRYPGRVGVEVFPMFHVEGYEALLSTCLPEFKKVPISFHGPYYKADYSTAPNSKEYEYTMRLTAETLKYGEILHSRYMVFHHNNCRVWNSEEMLKRSCANFREVEAMAADHGIPVVVENAGVVDLGNMLLGENSFIRLCREENYKVLIDIGHAHANGWDILHVMEELKDQIVAYHLHNNDGIHDSHRRIGDGNLNFKKFMDACLRLSPNADHVLEYSPNVANDEEGICADIETLLNCQIREPVLV